jgi:hypothetical protein
MSGSVTGAAPSMANFSIDGVAFVKIASRPPGYRWHNE